MSALRPPTRFEGDLYDSMLEQVSAFKIEEADTRGAMTTRKPALLKVKNNLLKPNFNSKNMIDSFMNSSMPMRP